MPIAHTRPSTSKSALSQPPRCNQTPSFQSHATCQRVSCHKAIQRLRRVLAPAASGTALDPLLSYDDIPAFQVSVAQTQPRNEKQVKIVASSLSAGSPIRG